MIVISKSKWQNMITGEKDQEKMRMHNLRRLTYYQDRPSYYTFDTVCQLPDSFSRRILVLGHCRISSSFVCRNHMVCHRRSIQPIVPSSRWRALKLYRGIKFWVRNFLVLVSRETFKNKSQKGCFQKVLTAKKHLIRNKETIHCDLCHSCTGYSVYSYSFSNHSGVMF